MNRLAWGVVCLAAGCSGKSALSGDGAAETAPPADPARLVLSPVGQKFVNVIGPDCPSPTVVFTVANIGGNGSGSLTVTSGPDFPIVADTCQGQPLPAAGTCKVSLQFKRTTVGYSSSALTVMAQPGGTAVANLTGTGVGGDGVILTPNAVDFSTLDIGLTSQPATFELRNIGGSGLMVDDASVSTDEFVKTSDTCTGHTLAPDTTCQVQVAFRPYSIGARTAILTVPTRGCGGGPATAPLAGTGTAPAGRLVISPLEVDFGPGYERCRSGATVLRISNGAAEPIGPVDVTLADTFEVQNSHCYHITLAPQEACEITVGFPRWNPGKFSADLVVSAPGREARAKLRGEVFPSVDPLFTGAPQFPQTMVSAASAPVEVTLLNPGGAPTTTFTVTVTNVAASEYRITDTNCDQAVPGGSTCRLHIVFVPASTGVRNASLNASGATCGSGATSLQLQGVGVAP
jgi:hypothetical protein